MKLYVVISAEGLYDSDVKTVEGVYTSQELAEHAAKLYGGAEVREILADMIPKHPEGCYPYEVDLNPGALDDKPAGVLPSPLPDFYYLCFVVQPKYWVWICPLKMATSINH